jgi:hypothetical protein
MTMDGSEEKEIADDSIILTKELDSIETDERDLQ